MPFCGCILQPVDVMVTQRDYAYIRMGVDPISSNKKRLY